MPDQSLELLVKTVADTLGITLTEDKLASLVDSVKETTKASGDLSEQMTMMPEEFKDIGDKAGESGHKMDAGRLQYLAMHHMMAELNTVAPGLGTAMHFLSEGFMKAGESAKEAGGGVGTFTTALDEAMASILPLLAVMLTVQEATKLWEAHKQKIEEVAKAQEEACKAMVEANDKLIKSTHDLDEALHPTKNVAQKDEADLKKKIDLVKEQAATEKELNKANEEREMASATNDAQKQAIRDKYKQMDRNVDMLTASQTAGLQSAAAENAQKQIADIETRMAATKARIEQENTELEDKAKAWQAFEPQKAADARSTIASNNAWLAGYMDTTRSQAGDLGAFANNTQSEADTGAQTSANQRNTYGQVGRIERYTEAEQNLLKDKQFVDLLNATNKSHDQIENILQLIITRHVTLQTVIEQMQAQMHGLSRQ